MTPTRYTLHCVGLLFVISGLILPLSVATSFAQQINRLPSASPSTGPLQCRPPYSPAQCWALPFDTSQDFAFQGNGFAAPAVARDNINGFPAIHQSAFANDGFYGNGSSWISAGSNSWLKVDLGRPISIETIWFGRDRAGGFDDRDPGQFTIAVAQSENVYADGDDSNDASEYALVFDSTAELFDGQIYGAETLEVRLVAPVLARFVKLTVANYGTDIDEVQVFGAIPVSIDIKPGSASNSINVHSSGVVPVAILSSVTFDALSVDPSTVTLAGAAVRLIGKVDKWSCSAEDVNGDGLPDLVCHVSTAELVIQPGDTSAILEATTFSGDRIRGVDSIRVVR